MYAVCRRLTSCRQATNALMWINYLDRQSASFNKKSYCSPRAKGVFRLDSACGFVAFLALHSVGTECGKRLHLPLRQRIDRFRH